MGVEQFQRRQSKKSPQLPIDAVGRRARQIELDRAPSKGDRDDGHMGVVARLVGVPDCCPGHAQGGHPLRLKGGDDDAEPDISVSPVSGRSREANVQGRRPPGAMTFECPLEFARPLPWDRASEAFGTGTVHIAQDCLDAEMEANVRSHRGLCR